MSDEEIISLNRMKLFARSSDLSIVTAKDMEIVVNLVETQQKEIESLKKENLEIRDWKYTIDTIEDLDKLKELDLIKIKGKEYISKDKIKAKIEEEDELFFKTKDVRHANRYKAYKELLEEE